MLIRGGGYWKELYCVNTKTEPHYPSLGPHLTWINALSRTFPQGLSVRHSCLQCQSDRPSPASRRNQTTGLETVSSSEWKTRDKNEGTAPTFLPDRAGFSQTTLRAVLLIVFWLRPVYSVALSAGLHTKQNSHIMVGSSKRLGIEEEEEKTKTQSGCISL